MSFKNWSVFEKLTAQDVNTQLMRQAVMTFASATERDATLTSGIVLEGMVCYLADVNVYYMNLNGTTTGWYPIAGQTPRFEVTKNSTGLTVASSTVTLITGFTTVMNRGGFSESSGSFFIPLTGRYNLSAVVSFTSGSSSSGVRMIEVRRYNSSNVLQETFNSASIPWSSTNNAHIFAMAGVQASAGDYFNFYAYQTSGANTTVIGTAAVVPKIIIEWVGI